MKNVLRNTTIVAKLGMFILILGMLVSCASPPQVVNDPTIPDNGVIILNIGAGDPYQRYPGCRPPFQMGQYWDPYRARQYPDSAIQFYLRNNQNNP